MTEKLIIGICIIVGFVAHAIIVKDTGRYVKIPESGLFYDSRDGTIYGKNRVPTNHIYKDKH